MRDEYAGLADVYDRMTRIPGIRVFYREWRQALLAAARERGVRPRVLVDLACGTGNSTVPWSRRRGWLVVGVDRSAAMLKQARRKSTTVRWYRQDVIDLSIKEQADLVTCHFDALNHILRDRDLHRVFANVAGLLREGGLFQFDLNTGHMLRWLNGRDKLFRAGRDCFTSHNEFDVKSGVATFHQWWFLKRGRLYERRHVAVRERAYSDAVVRTMLRISGMRLLNVTVQRRVDGKPARKLYLATKAATRRHDDQSRRGRPDHASRADR